METINDMAKTWEARTRLLSAQWQHLLIGGALNVIVSGGDAARVIRRSRPPNRARDCSCLLENFAL
jgi:hypothetical protein